MGEMGQEAQQAQARAVAVFWRESKTSPKGHVGFYVDENSTHALCSAAIKATGKHRQISQGSASRVPVAEILMHRPFGHRTG